MANANTDSQEVDAANEIADIIDIGDDSDRRVIGPFFPSKILTSYSFLREFKQLPRALRGKKKAKAKSRRKINLEVFLFFLQLKNRTLLQQKIFLTVVDSSFI